MDRRIRRARGDRRLFAVVLACTMVAQLPASAAAAPPIAGDDPGPACMGSAFGGSFPIPEDWGQFAFVDGHVCGISYNDSDPDGDPRSYALVTAPAHGELQSLFSFDSTVGYTPDPDYFTLPGDVPGGTWESDSWVYEVTAGGETDQATMRFWIAPVNDEPSFAAGDAVSVAEDSGAYSSPWASDIFEGPGEGYQTVSFSVVEYPVNPPGLFAVQPAIDAAGVLSFTPAADRAGIARYTVTAKDDGGLESYSGVNLDPPPDDTSDGVELVIHVTSAADPAVAIDDAYAIDEDAGPTSLSVLSNDSDADGDAFAVTSVTQGSKGTVAVAAGGAGVVYTPIANANGDDTFTYGITGGDTATAVITIDPVNDAPVALDDPAGANCDASATGGSFLTPEDHAPLSLIQCFPLSNDTDIDGDALAMVIVDPTGPRDRRGHRRHPGLDRVRLRR